MAFLRLQVILRTGVVERANVFCERFPGQGG
jgi:hypothetical protein